MPSRLSWLVALCALAVPGAAWAQTPPPATAAAPASGAAADRVVSDELKELTWIGFQQLQDASRVFVRTNEPVRYNLSWRNQTVLLLELYNTQVMVKNHLRFLDTQFFDSPVLLIKAAVNEAVSPTTRVEITVRQKVPFQAKHEDNLVFIDFKR